ncbi:MAG: CAP domain-containing protein [Breznakibacter sp.]
MKVLSCVLLFLTLHIFGAAQPQHYIAQYLELNEKETRLLPFKDSKEALILKLKQVEYINKSRKKHKAPPVELDILASRMANQIAIEAALNNYSGHFNLKGEAPYIRFANSGGTDHVTENAAAASYDRPIDANSQAITHNMQLLHDAFMAEKAPNDGHKKTCIDKFHNFVGIGYAVHGKEFRYYEEYLDRYLQFEPFNHQTTDNKVTLRFKPIDSKKIPYFVIVYHQPVPRPLTASQIDKIASYDDYTEKEHLNLGPWEIPQPEKDGLTTLNLKFEKKGYYYVQIFLSDTPHKKGGKASTVGKVQASGVVIQVK